MRLICTVHRSVLIPISYYVWLEPTFDVPEFDDESEIDQVKNRRDYDRRQRRVGNVGKDRSQEQQNQYHQDSYRATNHLTESERKFKRKNISIKTDSISSKLMTN